MKEQYLQKQNTPFFKDQFDVKPHLYLHLEMKLYHPDFLFKRYLHSHLKALRVKFKLSVTHLALILNCSRPQYLRMERGENLFKDEQLEALASIYGEEISTYKDMQDVDYLLRKISYNDNPERTIHLLELALKAITIPSDEDHPDDNGYPVIPENLFIMKPVSKEFQQQKLAEIIENLHRRFQQHDVRMTEIGKKLDPMADTPNPEKGKLWSQFHLLEDEQTSILKLVTKLQIKEITELTIKTNFNYIFDYKNLTNFASVPSEPREVAWNRLFVIIRCY